MKRLADLLNEPDPGLDRVLAVIGTAVDDEAPSEDAIVERLDAMAADCPESTIDGVLEHVYGRLGFAGDVADYYSPANSLIHEVLDRRRGIPLSLAAVAGEIGRRLGVDLRPVGLPGHVLLGAGADPSMWFDPFAAGAKLTVDDCRRLFARFHPVASFQTAMLAPIDATVVAVRTLNNLRGAFMRRGEPSRTIPILELVLSLPGAGTAQLLELANLLTTVGRYDNAADAFERLSELDPDGAEAHRRRVLTLRAHRN